MSSRISSCGSSLFGSSCLWRWRLQLGVCAGSPPVYAALTIPSRMCAVSSMGAQPAPEQDADGAARAADRRLRQESINALKLSLRRVAAKIPALSTAAITGNSTTSPAPTTSMQLWSLVTDSEGGANHGGSAAPPVDMNLLRKAVEQLPTVFEMRILRGGGSNAWGVLRRPADKNAKPSVDELLTSARRTLRLLADSKAQTLHGEPPNKRYVALKDIAQELKWTEDQYLDVVRWYMNRNNSEEVVGGAAGGGDGGRAAAAVVSSNTSVEAVATVTRQKQPLLSSWLPKMRLRPKRLAQGYIVFIDADGLSKAEADRMCQGLRVDALSSTKYVVRQASTGMHTLYDVVTPYGMPSHVIIERQLLDTLASGVVGSGASSSSSSSLQGGGVRSKDTSREGEGGAAAASPPPTPLLQHLVFMCSDDKFELYERDVLLGGAKGGRDFGGVDLARRLRGNVYVCSPSRIKRIDFSSVA